MCQSEEIRAWARTKWRRKLVKESFYSYGERYCIDEWNPEKELSYYETLIYKEELQMRIDHPNFIR